MKKIIALLLALTMVFALAACAKQTTETPATETTTTPETTTTEENTTTEETPAAETTEAADLKVGVFYYTFADTYISSVRTALDAQLDSLGVAYQNFDGNNNQTTQNEQIQTALTDGGRRFAATHEAAAEGLDRRVVPLGIFQYSQRHPYSCGGRSVGIVNREREIRKWDSLKQHWAPPAA